MPTPIDQHKLDYFAATIQSEVESRLTQIQFEAQATQAKLMAEALTQAAKQNRLALKLAQSEIKRDTNKRLAQARTVALSNNVRQRVQNINKLFKDIEATLANFIKQPKYKDYLLKRISESKVNYPFTIIKLSPQDMHLEEEIKTYVDMIIEQGNIDYIGGFILLNESRTIQLDCTFKTRLAAAKKDFNYDRR